MKVIVGTAEVLSACQLFDLACYRHRVFVQRLGWKLEGARGRMELDQFDRRDTCYVIAQDEDDEIIGTARLLPTTRPYLLADVFPDLMGASPLPRAVDVWELSRFAAVNFRRPETGGANAFTPSVALAMLRAAMEVAAAAGVKQLISVSPRGVERILRAAGVRTQRSAPPRLVDGRYLFVCCIEVDLAWHPPVARPALHSSCGRAGRPRSPCGGGTFAAQSSPQSAVGSDPGSSAAPAREDAHVSH